MRVEPELTRPVTGRSLRIHRHFTQKGFEIFVNKELIQVVTRLRMLISQGIWARSDNPTEVKQNKISQHREYIIA